MGLSREFAASQALSNSSSDDATGWSIDANSFATSCVHRTRPRDHKAQQPSSARTMVAEQQLCLGIPRPSTQATSRVVQQKSDDGRWLPTWYAFFQPFNPFDAAVIDASASCSG